MICFHILNNFQQQKTSSQGKETFYAFINYLCPYMSKILKMIKKDASHSNLFNCLLTCLFSFFSMYLFIPLLIHNIQP